MCTPPTLPNLRYPTNTQQVVLLFIFSFTDPRKCKLHIDRIHVATNDEIVSKMDESFWGVPWFMCDFCGMGMKATTFNGLADSMPCRLISSSRRMRVMRRRPRQSRR